MDDYKILEEADQLKSEDVTTYKEEYKSEGQQDQHPLADIEWDRKESSKKASNSQMMLKDNIEEHQSHRKDNLTPHGPVMEELEFVSNHALQFGLESTDSDLLISYNENDNSIFSDTNTQEKEEESSESKLTTLTKQKEKSENNSNSNIMISIDNRGFLTESEPASSTVKETSEKSPLLLPEQPSAVKELLKKNLNQTGTTIKHNDKVPLLYSPSKADLSSEEDSTLMSVSLDLDMQSLRSPGLPSSDAEGDDPGGFSKYSQLSEDGSSPSSFNKIQTSNEQGHDGKPPIFDNPLELGVAFSEFVDLNSYRLSLGLCNPQTEDKFGGKSEDHLVVLLKNSTHKNLKMFLRRSGWPAESDARHHMWENMCIHLVKAGGNLYHDMIKEQAKKQFSEEDVSLPSFVDPTLLTPYHLNTYGLHMARMVINLIAHLNPDVLYCPLLFPLTTAFLHYMGPNACFNCMQAILRSSHHLTATKSSTRAVSLVIKDLAKKYTKSAYVYVTQGVDETVFDHWMYWLFQDLPFQTLVCIVDCFLLEGRKVLYRVILAILSRFYKHIKKSQGNSLPPEDMKQAISSFCSNMPFDSKRLLKIGFSIRGLTRKEIQRLKDRHNTYIRNNPLDMSIHIGQVNNSSTPTDFLSGDVPEVIVQQGQISVLTREMLGALWSWIPERMTLMNLCLLYTSDEHGITLRTLLGRTENAEQSLLIIKTDQDEIFGAYCSAPWALRRKYNKPHMSFFGTGESFVFTLSPSLHHYTWVGADGSPTDWSSDLFMAADDSLLYVGSGNGEAIQLDSMMNRCRSTRCNTFNNEPLTTSEDFICSLVQVYGFVD